jgi:small-conductance mechanosensitive channel
MEEVTTTSQASQGTIVELRAKRFPMPNRDHTIQLAPEKANRGQRLNVIDAREQLTRLTAPIHHISHSACEGASSARRSIHLAECCELSAQRTSVEPR